MNLDYLHVWHAGVVANERVGQTANFNFRSARNQSFANAVYLSTRSASPRDSGWASAAQAVNRPDRLVHPGVRVVIGVVLTFLLAVSLALGRRITPSIRLRHTAWRSARRLWSLR